MRFYATKRLLVVLVAVLLVLLQDCRCHAFRPPLISQELGCSPTLSKLFGGNTGQTKGTKTNNNNNDDDFFFDPLQLATNDNFVQLREAELKHGRVCMLAVLETMLVPVLRHVNPTVFNSENLPSGITTAIPQHAFWPDYAVVLVTCGILETVVLVQKDPQAMPGDYGTGYWGVQDKGAHESSLVAELENGRLAMMAFLIQIFCEQFVAKGTSWEEQWLGIFQEWIREQLVSGGGASAATAASIDPSTVTSNAVLVDEVMITAADTAATAAASTTAMDSIVNVLMLVQEGFSSVG